MRSLQIAFVAVAAFVLGGCPVPQAQNTPVVQRLETDKATGREFYIYVPSSYRHNRPAPVVISCHGTPPYDIAEHHIREWKMLGEQYGCIIVAPKLTGTDGIFGTGPTAQMLSNERLIMSILANLGYRYNIDRANIMITGFSGGGFPAYWVGLRHPDIFSAIAARNCNFNEGSVDGWYPPEAAAIAVCVYYGQLDPVAIQGQSTAAIRYLRGKGFTVKAFEIPGAGHDRHPEYAMEFFREHWRPSRGSLSGAR